MKIEILLLSSLVFTRALRLQKINPDCKCGMRKEFLLNTRIFGGRNAEKNEFPWQVFLEVFEGNKKFTCGGSIISDRYILTAAHCLQPDPDGVEDIPIPPPENMTVIVGEHDTSTWDRTEQALEVSNYLIHPKNVAEDTEYDYALLRLKYPIDFGRNENIRPICLPERRFVDFEDNTPVVATGWGRGTTGLRFTYVGRCNDTGLEPSDSRYVEISDEGCLVRGVVNFSPPSEILQKVDLFVVKHRECAKLYDRFSTALRPEDPVRIFGNNVCATRPDKLGDVCQGDSGGSLSFKRDDGRYEVVGIVSYGFGCGSEFEGEAVPAVFGRISSVITWIQESTRDGIFCS